MCFTRQFHFWLGLLSVIPLLPGNSKRFAKRKRYALWRWMYGGTITQLERERERERDIAVLIPWRASGGVHGDKNTICHSVGPLCLILYSSRAVCNIAADGNGYTSFWHPTPPLLPSGPAVCWFGCRRRFILNCNEQPNQHNQQWSCCNINPNRLARSLRHHQEPKITTSLYPISIPANQNTYITLYIYIYVPRILGAG